MQHHPWCNFLHKSFRGLFLENGGVVFPLKTQNTKGQPVVPDSNLFSPSRFLPEIVFLMMQIFLCCGDRNENGVLFELCGVSKLADLNFAGTTVDWYSLHPCSDVSRQTWKQQMYLVLRAYASVALLHNLLSVQFASHNATDCHVFLQKFQGASCSFLLLEQSW